MINVQIAHSLISLITFVLAYIISVTCAGFFTSWVALKMGDDTPEQNGFLTLNPLAHLDLMGLAFMMLFRFGWGRFIPINPFNITGRHKIIKLLTAFLAEPVCYVLISITSFVLMIAIMGKEVLFASAGFFDALPHLSSYSFAIGLILISMMVVNMMLAIITFLVNMVGLAVMTYMEKNPEYMQYTSLIMVLVPITFFYLFRAHMMAAIFFVVKLCGICLAALIGLL